ncbi:MAG TPA: carbamoyltransferase C-terminal domain-containing protein, partial [Bdellovibrionota bacterium]|nr:carbamoyltransferase C-terminal domain-containing protein [Bdellovibrionota bacterium]
GSDLEALYCPGLCIGNAYYAFTERLGIGNPIYKAGSTMGLAAYGRPQRHRFHSEFVKSFIERRFATDSQFIDWMWFQLSGLLPSARMTEIDQRTMNVAASLQLVFEDALVAGARRLFEETAEFNEGNLVLSGGSLLNCNANARILRESGFSRVHLFPACGDDGTAVGSALYLTHHLLKIPRRKPGSPSEISRLGPSHEIPQIGERLDLGAVADAISRGKVVAWFQGRSEFGPRALGGRSILADPRSSTMRDHLNFQVKHREWFRPFGPSVLEEDAPHWFDWEGPSPFMLFTCKTREPSRIPAVTHVDGTARIQTVSRENDPLYYDLISEVKRRTDVPMVLNTSFNLGGQPLIETPEEALQAFETSRLDVLVMGDRMLSKLS